MVEAAVNALRRFGLGARPGEIAAIKDDPLGYLVSQIRPDAVGLFDGAGLTSDAAWQQQRDYIDAVSAIRKSASSGTAKPVLPKNPAFIIYRKDALARTRQAIMAPNGLAERMAAFWSGHFCISEKREHVRGIAGAYEREAIRSNVFGRFAELLVAVVQHPAMLSYLDNLRSTGPNSPAGKRLDRGINENLAREILELHTLGVDGGYTQADVTSFAKVLTGWTVASGNRPNGGQFVFNARMHEPGPITVLGRRYADMGEEQGLGVLADIARHPATARHIATKLVRHFISQDAPAATVAEVEAAFTKTDGDLAEVTKAVVRAKDSLTIAPRKVLPPYDLLVASCRALDISPDDKFILGTLNNLGQRLWDVPSPQGWPEDDEYWAAPDALVERIDWVSKLAGFVSVDDVAGRGREVLGTSFRVETEAAIARAENRLQGIALLLLSSEFQRR
ncbi:DUF1800 family protein [soil metagenome]